MTREDAIRIIKIVLAIAEDFEITVQGEEFTEEKCKEAVEMATKALEQEPCEDAISRSEAITAIEEKAKRIKSEDTLNGLAGAVGILFDLPPVKPQEKTGHWIDDKCSICGKGIEDLIDSSEWYRNESPRYCPFCGIKIQPYKAESEE